MEPGLQLVWAMASDAVAVFKDGFLCLPPACLGPVTGLYQF